MLGEQPDPVAEVAVAILMQVESLSSREWAREWLLRASTNQHEGDCLYAEPANVAPFVCSRCVAEEYMAAARTAISAYKTASKLEHVP